MKVPAGLVACVFAWMLGDTTNAKDIFVNHEHGSDASAGFTAQESLQTIQQALKSCGPGDVIHLEKTVTPYHEGILIEDGKSGLSGKSITIDGHGATLTGSTHLRPEDWTSLGNGLYRNDALLPELFPRQQPVNEALLRRFFFLFNGKMVRMGRNGKGDCPPLPKPEDLKQGEWTYDATGFAFYLKIEPNKELANENIEYPDLGNGLRTSDGRCEYLVVRNLKVTHFWNDGFNLNGATVKMRFENIQATECGDDGMSAHTDSQIEVDGFISRGNTTGICHVQGSHSVSRRLMLEGNCAFEVLLTGSGTHEISDSLILPRRSLTRVIRLSSEGAEDGKGCRLVMDNVLVDGDHFQERPDEEEAARLNHEFAIEIVGKCSWLGRRLTLFSVGLTSKWPTPGISEVSLFDSLVGGKIKPGIVFLPQTVWEAENNGYDLAELGINGKQYAHAQWEEYRKLSGQDKVSTWEMVTVQVGDRVTRGADLKKLPPLPRPGE